MNYNLLVKYHWKHGNSNVPQMYTEDAFAWVSW